ncbi:MAG: hypothetical protein C0598_14395, partial [Marinilabiliales bacterium]
MNSLELFKDQATRRVILRPISKEDVDVVFAFNSSSESLTYIAREPFKTIKEAQDKLDFFLAGNANKTSFWWVFVCKETGEKIGYGGLFDISEKDKRAEIGYGLIKQYWNKGYMSEILKEIIKFAFTNLELHKIYGVVIKGNIVSQGLLKKNGFVREAYLKDHSFARGRYFDEMVYGLLNE